MKGLYSKNQFRNEIFTIFKSQMHSVDMYINCQNVKYDVLLSDILHGFFISYFLDIIRVSSLENLPCNM